MHGCFSRFLNSANDTKLRNALRSYNNFCSSNQCKEKDMQTYTVLYICFREQTFFREEPVNWERIIAFLMSCKSVCANTLRKFFCLLSDIVSSFSV